MTTENAYARRKLNKELRLMRECDALPHARLIALFHDADPMRRSAAVRQLHLRNTRSALRDALRLCRNPDPLLRENAALVLGQLIFQKDDTKTTETAVNALLFSMATTDSRAFVRAGALCALGPVNTI